MKIFFKRVEFFIKIVYNRDTVKMERYAMYPRRKQLSPSLFLSAVQTDKFKTETLSVSIVTQTDRKRSPASLLALSVLKRGTEKFKTQAEINLRLDELYATSISLKTQRCGNANILGFVAEMLCEEYTDGKTDIFGGTLEVLCQMLFCPLKDEMGHFLDAYIESEKSNQCDAIAAQINNLRAYASMRCREIMFKDDPYSVNLLGTTEGVTSITREELSSVYKNLVSNYRYEIFYIGPRNIESVEKCLERDFLPYIKNGEQIEFSQAMASNEVAEVKRVTEEMPLAQGKLVLGFRTGINLNDPDFYAMLVMNEIYGGSPVSKLFMNVRERLSLCYYCGASYDIFKGAIFVSSGISPKNKERAEGEILRQLGAIKQGNITSEELEAAKHSLCNSYRALSDSPALLEGYYFCRNEFGIDCSVDECMESIQHVELADVIRVAAKVTLDTVYFLNGNGEENEDGIE